MLVTLVSNISFIHVRRQNSNFMVMRFLLTMCSVTFVVLTTNVSTSRFLHLAGPAHKQTREMMREEADIADEKRLAAKIVAQAKVAAPRLATMSAISEHRNRWVAYKVCSK